MSAEASGEAPDGNKASPFPKTGLYHKVRAGAFLPVRQLRRAYGCEPLGRHAGPGKHAGALHMGGGGDDDYAVNAPPAATLEQQRDVENDERHAPHAGAAQKSRLRLANEGVHDALELAEFVRLSEHRLAKRRSVEPRRMGDAGKRLLDGVQRPAARSLQTVHLSVCVEDRHAPAREHGGHRRLAHADGAGEADDLHAVSSARSSASPPAGAAVPKKSSNASRAWPISIDSPSTVSRPRRRAAASSGVSRGAYTIS